jgi:hypothetical protein
LKLVRIALGLIVAAYGVLLLVPVLNITDYKLGWMHHIKPAALRLIPLWRVTEPWQLTVWSLAVVLMLAAGVQLLRGRAAFRIFVAAFVVDAGLWWAYRDLPEYQQVFTPAERLTDYYTLAFMLMVGSGIWLVERRPKPLTPAI